jgi:hypothetical protein
MTPFRRKPPEDWEKKFAALLKELPSLPESFKFTGSVHQGGLAALNVEVKIK